ncbi:MAG: DUF2382 domain-containing protein [Chloroflexota bacterium]
MAINRPLVGRRSGSADLLEPAGNDDEGPPATRQLPLQAAVEALNGGWSVRVPVRAEDVTVTKEAVLREEVRVWRSHHQEIQTVSAPVRSERLQVAKVEPQSDETLSLDDRSIPQGNAPR